LGLLDDSNTKMNTLADLNLLTYVIKLHDDSDASYVSNGYVSNGEHISSHDTRVVSSTTDISQARIFNDSQEAQRIAKRLNDHFCAKVIPVSKKIFFEASLKGNR